MFDTKSLNHATVIFKYLMGVAFSAGCSATGGRRGLADGLEEGRCGFGDGPRRERRAGCHGERERREKEKEKKKKKREGRHTINRCIITP